VGDFPGYTVLPTHLSTWDQNSPAFLARPLGGLSLAGASIAWPAADLAIYVPYTIALHYPIRRPFWANGSSAASNVDIGIYTLGGAAVYRMGPTAQSGASAIQYGAASNFVLNPGSYYFAMSCSGTTNAMFGAAAFVTEPGRLMGLLQQAAAATLPAAMTGAAWASTGYPLFGFTRTTTGY